MVTQKSSEAAGKSAPASSHRAPRVGADVDEPSRPPLSETLQQISLRIAEIREFLAFLVSTKLDAAKLVVRNGVLYAIMGVVALLGVAAAVVTAVVLLLQGAADGISIALHTGIWAGDLIVAGAVLVVVVIGAWVVVRSATGSSRRNTVEKYESRKRDQRIRFGQDVGERAAGE